MIDGSRVGGGGFGEGAYEAMLQRIDEAGWMSAGSFDNEVGGVNAGFWRQEDKLASGETEAIERLGLLGEGDTLQPGFTVEVDDETDAVVVAYEGPRNERFGQFIDDLVAWGEELEARQTEALTDDQRVVQAQEVSNRLVAQMTAPAGKKFIGAILSAEKRSKESIVADVVGVTMPSFLRGLDLEGAQAIGLLETLFAYTATQQNGLLEKLEDQAAEHDTVKLELDLLDGIARGVQREIRLRRDAMAVIGA